jgi:hypothetical protein
MEFLDDDPEDGFDVTDPPEMRLLNIARRVSFVISLMNSPDLERRLRSVKDDLEKIRMEIIDG